MGKWTMPAFRPQREFREESDGIGWMSCRDDGVPRWEKSGQVRSGQVRVRDEVNWVEIVNAALA